MSIQWYPGHMVKARKLIAEAIPGNDVLVEVVDSRIPRASRNPELIELGRNKPLLIVLSKSDLSDPELTAAWVHHFEQSAARRGARVQAVAVSSTQQRKEARKLVSEGCRRLAPVRGPSSVKPLRALILGIPNVGKSTLTNLLQGRQVAKTEDRPGVTRGEQKVVLDDGTVLSDVPGLMWPRIEAPSVGLSLALCGAIPDTAIDTEPVALFALEILLKRYPRRLQEAFKLASPPASPDEALDAVGRKRGCLKSGGVVDRHKASGHVLTAFRSGTLGRITLDVPPTEPEPLLLPEE
jgi:ribosome biogenesis GTPase A